MTAERKKIIKIVSISLAAFVLVAGIAAVISINYFIGFPEVVGSEKYEYEKKLITVEYDDVSLYGMALIPFDDSQDTFPTVIYAHGAESDHSADMTTLKSLAMSGIACYSFDFYGWTNRSTGPEGVNWFNNVPRGVDDAYEKQVLKQVNDLNAVIEKVKTLEFVDTQNIFLLGSSMGGCVSAVTAVSHSDDIRGLIMQFPAVNLCKELMVRGSEYDANLYTGDVLILQGTNDVIVPLEMSQEIHQYYNTAREDHCTLRIYYNQPHVFNGEFKVIAARDIYNFITERL